MIVKFPALLVPTAQVARADVSPTLTIGEAARLLRLDTLEVATPLAMADRLGGSGLAAGDRLGVFADAPMPGDFPSPVRTGGREVLVRLGSREVSSDGRPSLTIGVPDPAEPPPDLDLREAASSGRVNLLPARCALLLFDGRVGQWFAALAGGARVLLDDYELTTQPIPINAGHRLRFFTPLDDPSIEAPLADVRVTVSAPQSSDVPRLPGGSFALSVHFGVEVGPFTLRASDNVRMGQIAAGLARQMDVDLGDAAQVARLRLAAPEAHVRDLIPGEWLYAHG